MGKGLRCKLAGCDRNECGVCRRCGDQEGADHAWIEVERDEPCYRKEACDRCSEERAQPDHDWQSIGGDLQCARCALKI